MMTSIDGRIVVDHWPSSAEARREYERVHATYDADAWMCGRITMEPFAGGTRTDDEVARETEPHGARPDFTAPDVGDSFAVAIDPSGRLLWESGEIDGDHVIAVLTQRVSDEYLARLRERGVSYLFAGERETDLGAALEKLAANFGIETLMLEGGGRINGAMLRDGLIDEVSLLVSPVADGTIGLPSLFDADGEPTARLLALEAVERGAGDVVWLRYRVV